SGANLELDWFDTIALHFAAFCAKGYRTQLVGTSRVIATSGSDPRYASWTKSIAQSHQGLRRLFDRQRQQFAMWKLPIFHTLDLDDQIHCVSLDSAPAAELSRVVVHQEWRGIGLSSELVNMAIAKADAYGVQHVFLECLEIHEEYYNKFGFTSLDQTGEVIGIGKTMVGMRRTVTGRNTVTPNASFV